MCQVIYAVAMSADAFNDTMLERFSVSGTGSSLTVDMFVGRGGHEATETGLAYAPVSQAHGHNHIVQCVSCCIAAQTSSVPHQVVADCTLASVLWTLRSARTHHPPTVPVSL